jgi:hypothetical protein
MTSTHQAACASAVVFCGQDRPRKTVIAYIRGHLRPSTHTIRQHRCARPALSAPANDLGTHHTHAGTQQRNPLNRMLSATACKHGYRQARTRRLNKCGFLPAQGTLRSRVRADPYTENVCLIASCTWSCNQVASQAGQQGCCVTLDW